MNDYLQNTTLRTLLRTLNIPIPIPPILRRNLGAYTDDELHAKKVAVTGRENNFLHQLQHAFHKNTSVATIYDESIDGLVISCIGMQNMEDLEDLYTHVKNTINKIAANGRIIID